MTEELYDVAIVGYGPTGLVAASALGAASHRVVVIEQHPTLYGLPRLTHIDGETARIVQATGDVDEALRDAQALDSFRYLNAEGDLLLNLPWAGESSGHPAHISMYQPDIEASIDARVRQLGNVKHMAGYRATSLDVRDDHVVLIAQATRTAAETGEPGDLVTIRSKYLLGADGANSSVRAALGIGQFDFGVDERWLNIDTRTLRTLPDRFNYTMLFCDPARPHMFMPIGTRRQRFEFAALAGEDKDVLEDRQRAWQWLGETHGLGPDDVEIIRQVLYPIKAKMADRWSSDNRVFLMGDAAHTMPPTMGQGACSGMRDAITLAWKLDLVLNGQASEALLATYEQERRPHAQTIVETSILLGEVAYTMDPVRAAARDEAFLNGTMPPPPPFPTIGSGVIHTTADGTPGPLAGTLAPQGNVSTVERTGRFDDIFGPGFTLVSNVALGRILGEADQAFLDGLGCITATTAEGERGSFRDDDGTYGRYFAEHGVEVFISRPDFVIFGAGAASDTSELIRQLRQKLSYVGQPSPAELAVTT